MFRQTLSLFACGMLAASTLGADPATQPSKEKEDAQNIVITGNGVDGTIKLPDGRVMNLKDLQGQGGAFSGVMVMRSVDNGGDSMTEGTDDNGRKFKITENDEGICVTLKEGDNPEQVFKAKDAEELEKTHPEAFEVYQQYAGHDHMMFMPAQGGGVTQNIRVVSGGAHGGMKMSKLGASFSPVFDDFVKAQLGEGVWVAKVTAESRAAKLGLEQYDLVKVINGNFIESLEDLKNNTSDEAKPLKVEILRAGKPMTLEEKL